MFVNIFLLEGCWENRMARYKWGEACFYSSSFYYKSLNWAADGSREIAKKACFLLSMNTSLLISAHSLLTNLNHMQLIVMEVWPAFFCLFIRLCVSCPKHIDTLCLIFSRITFIQYMLSVCPQIVGQAKNSPALWTGSKDCFPGLPVVVWVVLRMIWSNLIWTTQSQLRSSTSVPLRETN